MVKDEYSAGAVVSTGGMDIDGSDLGTIQHHPQSVYGYSSAGTFLKKIFSLFFNFCLEFFIYFYYYFFC